MSTAATSFGLGLGLALLLGFAGSPVAQKGPGGSGPGPGPGGHHRMISREALEGPPAPGVLRDSIGLTGDQFQRYTQRYAGHMAATGSVRDSLRTAMRSMRATFESGDRSGARSRHDALDRQAKELSKRDQEFEKALRQDLSKEQQK